MRTQLTKTNLNKAKFEGIPKNGSPDFKSLLQEMLIARCKSNPAYSLRAFAKYLQIEPSFLSKILSGKRAVTSKVISKLSLRLGLAPDETQKFLDHSKSPAKSKFQAHHYQDLTLDTFRMISDWYHYAILELVQVDGFINSPDWISKRLGIRPIEAQTAVERLLRLELLKMDDDGNLVNDSGGHTTVGNPFTAVAFRKLQAQIISQSLDALENTPIEFRDQSSMTMAIDPSLIPEAKEKIKKFRRELSKFLTQPGRTKSEVYQLSLSLFPVTKPQTKPKKTAPKKQEN